MTRSPRTRFTRFC